MKLVDILARELKVWPEGYNSLQQSFGGMVFHGAKDGILPIVCLSVAEDFRTAAVTRAQWQAAVDALNAEKEFVPYDFSGPVLDYGPKEWTGAGLPPVGTVCWYGEEMEEMRIVAHVDQGAQSGDARFLAVGQAGNMGRLRLAVAEYWRPTRTPEQIENESLYDRVLNVLRDDDKIREPGRIAKLVVAAISDVKAVP